MAKEFVMGARMTLTDAFSSPLRFIRDNMARTTASTDRFRDSTGRLRGEMGRVSGESSRVGRGLGQIAAAAAGAKGHILSLQGALTAVATGVVAKKGFDFLVQGNADMETYQNTLAVVLKDQDKAANTLKWAQTFAAQTPFEIPQVVEATTKLASYGLEAQKVLGVTGDMAAVMGKSLDQAVEAIADAQTGETERLKEFGITKKMIDEQAKKMGAKVMNSQGSITDQKAFNAALFALMEERYKGGMELQSKTFKGMLSNASDFIGTMGRTLGKPLFDKMKVGLGGLMDRIKQLQDSGQLDAWTSKVQNEVAYAWGVFVKFGGIVRNEFEYSFEVGRKNVEMITGKLKAWYSDHEADIKKVGQGFVDAFLALQQAFDQYGVPTIDWLRNTGLPGVVDVLTGVGTAAVETAAYFKDNWSTVGPLIEGIAIAWGGLLAVQKAMAVALAIETAAQWALNVAMNANPVGLVITAIGLLIGAGILLYQNWAVVKNFAIDLWVTIGNSFQTGVNVAIDYINKLIDVVNKIPGIDLGHIDRVGMLEDRASATARTEAAEMAQASRNSHATGLFRVPFDNYQANLHRDERVLTANEASRYDEAVGYQKPPAAAAAGPQYNIAKLVEKVEIHAAPGDDGEALYQKFITVFHQRAKEAAGILSTSDKGGLL